MDTTLAAYYYLRHYMLYVDHYLPSLRLISPPAHIARDTTTPPQSHFSSDVSQDSHLAVSHSELGVVDAHTYALQDSYGGRSPPSYNDRHVIRWESVWEDPVSDPHGLRGEYKSVFPPSVVSIKTKRGLASGVSPEKTHANIYNNSSSVGCRYHGNSDRCSSDALSTTYEAIAISKRMLDRPMYISSSTTFIRSVMECERKLASTALYAAKRVIASNCAIATGTRGDERFGADLAIGAPSHMLSSDGSSIMSPQIDSSSFLRQSLLGKHNSMPSNSTNQHQQRVKYPIYYHCMHFISSPVLDAEEALLLYKAVSEMTSSPNAMPAINMSVMEFFDVFIRHMNIAFPNYFDQISHALDCSAITAEISTGVHDRDRCGMLDGSADAHHQMNTMDEGCAYYPNSSLSNSAGNEKIYIPPKAPRNMEDVANSDGASQRSRSPTCSLPSSHPSSHDHRYRISGNSDGIGKSSHGRPIRIESSKSTGLSGIIPGDYILRAVCFFFKCNKVEALIRYISPLIQHGILLFNDSMMDASGCTGVPVEKVKRGGGQSENRNTINSKASFISAIYPLRHLAPADGSSKGFVSVSDIVNSFEYCSTFYCLQSIKQGQDLHNILRHQHYYSSVYKCLKYGPLPPPVASPLPFPSFLSNWPNTELTTHFIAIFSSETAIEGQSDVMYMSRNHQLMISYSEICQYSEEASYNHSIRPHSSFLPQTNDRDHYQDLQNVVLANALGPENFRRNFIGGFLHWMCLASLSARRGATGTLNESCMIVKSDACTVAFLTLSSDNSSIGCGGDDPAAWKPSCQRGKSEKSGSTIDPVDKSDVHNRDPSSNGNPYLKGNNKPLNGLAPDNVTIAIGFPPYIGEQEIRKGVMDVLSGTEMAVGPLESLPMAFYEHVPIKKKIKVKKNSDNNELGNETNTINEETTIIPSTPAPAPGVLFREACVPIGRTLLSLLNAVFYAPENPLYKLSVPRVMLNRYSPMRPVARCNETNILVSGFDRPTGIYGLPNAAVAVAIGGSPSVVRPCVKPYNPMTVMYSTRLLQHARECTEGVSDSTDIKNYNVPLGGSHSPMNHSASVKCLAVAIFFRGQLVVTDTHPTLAAHIRLAYIAIQHQSEHQGSSVTYDEIKSNDRDKQVSTFNRLKSGMLRDFIANLTAPETRPNSASPPPLEAYASIPASYHTPQPGSVFEERLLGGMGPPFPSSLQRRYPLLPLSALNGKEYDEARMKLIKEKEEENLRVVSDPSLWRRGINKGSASDYAACVLEDHIRREGNVNEASFKRNKDGCVPDIPIHCDESSVAEVASLDEWTTNANPPFPNKFPSYFSPDTSDMVCSSGFEVCLNKQSWALLWSADPKSATVETNPSDTQNTFAARLGNLEAVNKSSIAEAHVYKDPVQGLISECKTMECGSPNDCQGEGVHSNSKSVPKKGASTKSKEALHAALRKKLMEGHKGFACHEEEYPCERLSFNGVEVFILMDRHLPLPSPLVVSGGEVGESETPASERPMPHRKSQNGTDISNGSDCSLNVHKWRTGHRPVMSITPASSRVFNRLYQGKNLAQWMSRNRSVLMLSQSSGLDPSLSLRTALTEDMRLLRYALVYYDISQKPQPNHPTAAHKPLPNTCGLLHTKSTATTIILEASPYDNRVVSIFGEHDSNPSHNKTPFFPLTATQVANQSSKGYRPPPSTGSINRANQLADEAKHITNLLGSTMMNGVAVDSNMGDCLPRNTFSHDGGSSEQQPTSDSTGRDSDDCVSGHNERAAEDTAELSLENMCGFGTKPITRAILGRSSFGPIGDRGGVFSLLYGRETAERSFTMGSCEGYATVRNSDEVFRKFARGSASCLNINLM